MAVRGDICRAAFVPAAVAVVIAVVAALSISPAAVPPTQGAEASETEAECPIQFQDITADTGITFVHSDGSSGKHWMFEPMASGVAVFDYDNDGKEDIYFLTGTPLRGAKADPMPTNRLYHNEGGFKFADVTDRAGVGRGGYGLGVTVGDYNNSGHLDIFLNNFGPNILFRNNGDGTFTDVTKEAGMAGPPDKIGAGACFLDVDGSGRLDLFVAHYVRWSFETNFSRSRMGQSVYSGPSEYPTDANQLYRNNRDGTFKDVSAESGIAAHKGAGMGCIAVDYDNDGRTDIILANDQWPTFVYHNEGGGKFKEVGLPSGLAYTDAGRALNGMGVVCADLQHRGLFDVYITSYNRDFATLYRNLGKGILEDVTQETGAGDGTLPYVKWGNGFADFDNDGHKDIFVACGHLDDNVDIYDKTTSYLCPPVVLRNDGHGKFVNISDRCGLKGLKICGRGLALADLDNRGKIDVVILNSRRPPTILKNVSKNNNHWIELDLRGTKTNRFGVGAHVRVTSGDLVQLDEVHSGQGFQSHFGLRLHFGLGRRDRIDRIEVRWIGGGTEEFENVPVDRITALTEGTGKPSSSPAIPGAKGPSE